MTLLRAPLFRLSTWLIAGAAAAALTLGSSPAAACGACTCQLPSGLRPGNLRDDAPRNSRFLLALSGTDASGQPNTIDPEDITWTDADDEPVAFDVVPTDGTGDEVWLVPTEDLAADTEFRIQVNSNTGASTHLFGTGATVDSTAPEADAPTIEAIESSPACGTFRGALLLWDEIQDAGGTIAYDPVVKLDVQSGAASAVVFTTGTNLFPGRAVTLAVPGGDESATCWAQLGLPFADSDEPLTVTVTIYDAAGNALELDPVEVTLGESPGASCDGMTDGEDGQRGGGMCTIGVAPGMGGGLGGAWAWGLFVFVGGLVWGRRGAGKVSEPRPWLS